MVYPLLAFVFYLAWAQARPTNFTLHIKSALINPDCFNQSYAVLIVNDQFPAPALHMVKNDIVHLTVRNDVDNNVTTSIHLHGIRQLESNWADGVAGITQLAILPGQEFTQAFQVVDQSGTFYYHAHVGTQDDTVQGPLIVYESEEALKQHVSDGPYPYDGEHILKWSEWWHQSMYDREDYYMSPTFTADGGPDSILLNGQGVYPGNLSENCRGFAYFDVEPNKVYRLRHIGALTFRLLDITIAGHEMELIEVDNEYTEPYPIKSLEITAGQRMSTLIRTGNYSAGSLFPILSQYKYRFDPLNPGYTQSGYGYLRYVDPKDKKDICIMDRPEPLMPYNATDVIPGWVLPQVKPFVSGDAKILNATADYTIQLNMQQVLLPDNTTRFINNGRPYVHFPWGTANASLLDIIENDPEIGELEAFDGFSTRHYMYPVFQNKIVDFVFQNHYSPPPAPPGLCILHPWHIHGFSHYLLAEGAGDYNHETDKDLVTFEAPLLKDVSLVYPRALNGSTGCGWTRVRIFTDNPGVWAVHCHITAHMLQGKMTVLRVHK